MGVGERVGDEVGREVWVGAGDEISVDVGAGKVCSGTEGLEQDNIIVVSKMPKTKNFEPFKVPPCAWHTLILMI